MIRFYSAFDISAWMDNKDYPLSGCLKDPDLYGYDDCAAFLKDLIEVTEAINASRVVQINLTGRDVGWNGINISRCLKGLKKVNPLNLAELTVFNALLVSLTTKINASNATLNAQSIGNAVYGLQSMDSD